MPALWLPKQNKARTVRLKAGSRAATAHLNYLQRDGTTRDGGHGQLYGADDDRTDGASLRRARPRGSPLVPLYCRARRWRSALGLRGFTSDFMRQMEEDLGTRLDWVAVDHFNTGHAHSHVAIRGKDDSDKDLIIRRTTPKG